MLSDNILISTFIFFISCGILWVFIKRIQNSNLSSRMKRVLSYFGFAIIFLIIVIIFNHHSENYFYVQL